MTLVCAVFAVHPPAPDLDFLATGKDWQERYLQSRASWGSLRLQIAFNDTTVPASDLVELKATVIPQVTRWYQKVLRVPNLASPLKLPGKFCGQAVIPTVHSTDGVLADAVIYIVTVPKKFYNDDSPAYGAPCLLSSAVPKRVLAGSVWLTMDYWKPLSASKKVALLAHLFAHILGFNSVLYPHFSKVDGTLYTDSEILKSENVAGNVYYVLALPTVVARARRAFDCPSLSGVRLSERSDPDAYFLSHWSSKMMLNDFMSDLALEATVSFSDITLAVFQDSGWYDVQWQYTTPILFGRGRGCAFLTSLCIANKQPSFPEFCITGSDLCSPTFTARGQCTLIDYQYGLPTLFRYFDYFRGGPVQLDYCPVAGYSDSCVEGVSGVAGEEKCRECKCFAGVYSAIGGVQNTKNTHCHRVKCREGVAHVSVGSETVDCPPAGGSVTILGYTGSLQCPPFSLLCASLPCKNLCSGYGVCSEGQCVCEPGHFGDDCSLQCDITCASCTVDGQCAECRPGANLASGVCVCKAGLKMTSSGACTQGAACHPSCATCSGPGSSDCTSCQSPASLASGICVCPTGSVATLTGSCANCAAQCKACKYPETNVCLDCYLGAKLSSDSPFCHCPQGMFDTATRQCLLCDSLCASCSISPSICDTCIFGFQLSGGKCVCPEGSSNYEDASKCSACHSNCRSCAGSSSLDCLSCADDAFLSSLPGRCLCRYSTSQNCVQCVIGKECASCTPPSTYTCSSCYSNASLDLLTNTCVCKAGFFPDPDASYCSPCHASCLTCFADHYLACYSCPSYALQSGTQCVCTTSYYADADTKSCKPCSDSHCLMCDKAMCYHCIYGFDFDLTHLCTLQSGYYYDEGTKTTYACPSNCPTCSLSVSKVPTCTSCKYPTMVIDTGRNLCTCPAATYLDSTAQACKACGHAKCLSCSSATVCTQCQSPFVVATTASCACPAQTYEAAGSCKACQASCAACSGPEESQCTSCPSTSFLVSGYCLCLATSTSATCKKCGSGCLTCSPTKLDTCLTCATTASLSNGKCVCKEGYYPNSTALSCAVCSKACYSCLGPNVTDCVLCSTKAAPIRGVCECPSGYGLSEKSCVSCSSSCQLCSPSDYNTCTTCPSLANLRGGKCYCVDGYTPITLSPLRCFPCDPACSTCSALTSKDCVLCLDGSTARQGVCSCPDAYTLTDTGSCVACHFTCFACTAQTYNACTACYSSAILENGVCVCSPNRFAGQTCTKCPSSCKECGETGFCKSCYLNASASSTQCVCNSGFFPDPTPAKCSKCYKACYSCSGPNPTDCLSCRSYATLSPDNQCQCTGLTTQTRSGYCFLRSYLCADEMCLQCRDPLAYNVAETDSYNDIFGSCSCRHSDQFYVIPSRLSPPSAVLSPLFGFFDSFFYYYAASDLKAYFEDEMAGECLECSAICRGSCSQDPYDCWFCAPHANRISGDTVKRCACQQGYYFGGMECQKCSDGCLICESADRCSSCSPGYELLHTESKSTCKCVLPACLCPPNTYLIRSANTCESLCPSGYIPRDSECKEGPVRTFRFVLGTLTSPIVDQTSQFFMDAVDNSACGGFSFPPAAIKRLYQRGFWFNSDQPQCATLIPSSPNQFVFAPTHYVEMWVKAAEVVVLRYSEDYYVSTARSRMLYLSGTVVAFLNDNSKASKPVTLSASIQPTTKWSLLRYEFITTTANNQVSTLIRSYQDSKLLRSVLLNEYYFRDAPLDGKKAAFKVTATATGGAMMYDITLGNQEWQHQAESLCSCEQCTAQGDCLSNCAPLEFQRADKSCGSCNATCTEGCVRETDCEKITDPLCTFYMSFDQCLSCKLLALLNGNRCECVPHSTFTASKNECVCQPPYQPFGLNECRKCLNYLDSSDVTAEIEGDFLSLKLAFAVEMSVTMDASCADYFQPKTFAKFGNHPTCNWSADGKSLKVLLGAQATILPEMLYLNPETLVKKNGTCSFYSENLEPIALFRGDLPVPEVLLAAPESVSLSCASTMSVSALVTRGSKGRLLSYKWLFTHENLGTLFPQYSTYSADFAFLSLPLNSLISGNLSVSLYVLNGFGQSSLTRSVIVLRAEKALSLEIDSGGSLNINTQSVLSVAAHVGDSCAEAGLPSFVWAYISAEPPLSDSDPLPAAILTNTRALSISQGSLAGGHTYKFIVTVQQGTLTASAGLTVTVQLAPLLIRLNREGTAHPIDQNLLLDASASEDPDGAPGALTFQWTCVEAGKECADLTGKRLVTDAGSTEVLVTTNRMRVGAMYNFTVSVFKEEREASRWIVIEIVKSAGLFAVFPSLPETILPAQTLILSPSIVTNLVSKFQWTQITGDTVVPDTPTTYPFLAFSAGSLLSGQSYTFVLLGFTLRGSVSIELTFSVNRGPMGGSIAIEPLSGTALVDVFTLITNNWEDSEENYPLQFQFCVSSVCGGVRSLAHWVRRKLPAGEQEVEARCFDSLGASSDAGVTVHINTLSRRHLISNEALIEEFQTDIGEGENTCGLVVAYAQSVPISDTLAALMLSTLETFSVAISDVQNEVLGCTLSAIEKLLEIAPKQSQNFTARLVRVAETVSEKCDRSVLTVEHLQSIFRIAVWANSDKSWVATKGWVTATVRKLMHANFPDQSGFAMSTSELAIFSRRLNFNTLSHLKSLSVGSITLSMNENWISDFVTSGNSVVDLSLVARRRNDSAWVLEGEVWQVGSYHRYNYDALDERIKLELQNNPINVTLPRTSDLAIDQLECWASLNSGWARNQCQLIAVSSELYTVSTHSLSGVTVQKKQLDEMPGVPQEPSSTELESEDCSLNPAPLALSIGFLFLASCIGAIVLTISTFKRQEKGDPPIPPATDEESQFSVEVPNERSVVQSGETPSSNPNAELLPGDIRDSPGGDSNPSISVSQSLESGLSGSAEQESVVVDEVSVRFSNTSSETTVQSDYYGYFAILKAHLVFGAYQRTPMAWVRLSLFVLALQTEDFVLGLMYAFWYDGPTLATDSQGVWVRYSGTDFVYVCIAICCGTIASTLLQAILGTRKGTSSPLLFPVAAVCALLLTALTGAVIYLNVRVCWLPGGLWAESLLWTALLQFLVIETAKALLLAMTET